jgi:hypothetical protein
MQFEVCTLTAIRKQYKNGAENRAISTSPISFAANRRVWLNRQARTINRPDWRLSRQALLWLRLHMVRDDKPLPVYFLVDISRDVVELGSAAVFHFLGASFLTHLIRHVTIDVNVLV